MSELHKFRWNYLRRSRGESFPEEVSNIFQMPFDLIYPIVTSVLIVTRVLYPLQTCRSMEPYALFSTLSPLLSGFSRLPATCHASKGMSPPPAVIIHCLISVVGRSRSA